MDPQKESSSPSSGNNPQDAGSGPAPAGAPQESLGQEAANGEMPAMPMAGQKIEPQTPAPAADASSGAAQQSPSAGSPPGGQAPSSAGMPAAPGKRRKKGLFIGLIVAAIILLLSGGAAAAYFGYYLPNKPENVLLRALANTVDTAKTKTAQFNGSLTMTVAGYDDKLSGSFSGTASLENGAYDVTSEIDAYVTKITVDARSADGKTSYLRIGGLDGMSALLGGLSGLAENPAAANLYASYFDLLNDQWFEINESAMSQFAGGEVPDQKLTESGREELVETYHQNQFLVIKEKLSEQAIKGAQSHHYKVGIDETKLKSFFVAFKNAGAEELKLTDEQVDAINKGIEEADFDAFGLEVWIAKSDKTIRQLLFTYDGGEGGVEVRLTIDSYNEPVEVEGPEDAKSLLELMGGLLGGMDQAALETELETLFTEEPAGVPSTGISL